MFVGLGYPYPQTVQKLCELCTDVVRAKVFDLTNDSHVCCFPVQVTVDAFYAMDGKTCLRADYNLFIGKDCVGWY